MPPPDGALKQKEMLETQLSCRNHPINVIPFEALYNGSWHGADCLSIKKGNIFAQFNYRGSAVEEYIHYDYIRLRSRKATTFDCLFFLKPNFDVCVLSAHPTSANSNQGLQKALLSWYDAKIISIKRAFHADRCTCLFSVMVYRSKAPTNLIKNARDIWAEAVTIDNIAILQKLDSEPREDGHCQWNSSEDCTSSGKSKLLSGTGNFCSEIAWLVVLSTLKGVDFDIKLVQNEIVYHFLKREMSVVGAQSGGRSYTVSSSYDNGMPVLRFKKCEEKLRPMIVNLVPEVRKDVIVPYRTVEVDPVDATLNSDSEVEILYNHLSLRHSKRRKTVPDRYTGNFTQNSVRRSLGIDKHNMSRLERHKQQRPYTDDSSKACILLEEESYPVNYSISWGSSEHRGTISHAEVPQRKIRSEAKPAKLCSEHSTNSETFCADQQQETQRKRKWKSSSRRAERVREMTHLHSSNHLFPRSKKRRPSQRKKLLSATEYEQMIEMCLGNMKSEMMKETEPETQCTETQPVPDERLIFNWSPSSQSEVENDEHADLWNEMEYSLTTHALERKQDTNSDYFTGSMNDSNEDGHEPCQHDYKLNEEVGQVCQKCNYIIEIRHLFPPFLQVDSSSTWMDKSLLNENDWITNFLDSDPCSEGSTSEISHSECYDNVWASVADLNAKLHPHQKNAFEFIWRNIAGSLKFEEMKHLSQDTGGCVISHSPGSGKTLLVITFLISYLKLFPKIRPVILCPKIAVTVWCKEFEKWGFPFPVHQIHPIESYKKEMLGGTIRAPPTKDRKPSRREMHIMDCLLKFRQWHEHPSILLMGYSTFATYARDDSNLNFRKFTADILQKSPGILILDEGHYPRSTKSKLRKILMKVNTERRVLLSGTLFQNNFDEYFNTLSLARPRFIDDCISKLDPEMVNIRKNKLAKKMSRKEKLARKLFVEKVGQQIESGKEDERKLGFELLDQITRGFIDSYDGDTSGVLPGLKIYTLMLTSPDLQQEILEKLQRFTIHKRFPFELELLITFGTIHPWLVKKVCCVDQFFDVDELTRIENCKGNIGSGSKAKFVIDLVRKSTVRGERVLIFCHNIPPMYFLVKMFETVFQWTMGEEVLVLKGKQELSVRKELMDKFNGDRNEKCKVLLASTTACSEGISLVAASRVILLDSEWNHAKTRQAIGRAFRPGQERVVYVYRLLSSGTWEEEKFNSNAWKSWLAKMVFVGNYFEYTPVRRVEVIDDEALKELVDEDSDGLFRRIMTG